MRSVARKIALLLAIGFVTSIVAVSAGAQGKAKKNDKELTPEEKAAADLEKALKRAKLSEEFFSGTTPIDITLTTNIKRIRGDKQDQAPWRNAVFSYTDSSGKLVQIPAQIRTRGIWRLKNCEFPPLRINFKSELTKGTLLQGIDKPKLVNYCKDTDDYEQYILAEAQLYRAYNLLTPASHKARVVRIAYTDSASGKVHAKRLAIILEDPETMAARNGGPIMDLQGALPEDLDPYHDALAPLFQYFVGNTDWSIYALHNMELVSLVSGNFIPVAFDFDFSGAINTAYATVDPKLSIQRVRDRLFRGYCVAQEEWDKAFKTFNDRKDAIYGLYSDDLGKMMRPSIRESTLKYYDEFYKTINDPKRARKEISEDCVKTH
ncbi:MAG TPA: hypothetical protein VF042_13890 [Gemmatimonadaceae bacterium]